MKNVKKKKKREKKPDKEGIYMWDYKCAPMKLFSWFEMLVHLYYYSLCILPYY